MNILQKKNILLLLAFTIRDIWLNFRFFGEYDEKFSSKSRAHLSIKNSFQSKYNCAPSKILIQSSLPIKVPSVWEFIITSLIRVHKTIIIFQLILKDRGASEFSVYICSIYLLFTSLSCAVSLWFCSVKLVIKRLFSFSDCLWTAVASSRLFLRLLISAWSSLTRKSYSSSAAWRRRRRWYFSCSNSWNWKTKKNHENSRSTNGCAAENQCVTVTHYIFNLQGWI